MSDTPTVVYGTCTNYPSDRDGVEHDDAEGLNSCTFYVSGGDCTFAYRCFHKLTPTAPTVEEALRQMESLASFIITSNRPATDSVGAAWLKQYEHNLTTLRTELSRLTAAVLDAQMDAADALESERIAHEVMHEASVKVERLTAIGEAARLVCADTCSHGQDAELLGNARVDICNGDLDELRATLATTGAE